MPAKDKEPASKGIKPVVELEPACEKCGGTKFREANRIDNATVHSIMYECVECGEYRL